MTLALIGAIPLGRIKRSKSSLIHLCLRNGLGPCTLRTGQPTAFLEEKTSSRRFAQAERSRRLDRQLSPCAMKGLAHREYTVRGFRLPAAHLWRLGLAVWLETNMPERHIVISYSRSPPQAPILSSAASRLGEYGASAFGPCALQDASLSCIHSTHTEMELSSSGARRARGQNVLDI